MDNDIYLIGEVGWEITLQSVIDMVENTDKSKRLNAHIHSLGGDLYEGRAIYNYLKTLPQGVDTYAVGVVASAATVFMSAGKNKYAYSQNNVLIHLPMTGMHGNSEEMRERADSLEEEEIKIAKIYEQETNFTFDEAMALMKEDRMMTDDEVIKFGLEIKEYKAVAKFNSNKKKMSTENKKDGFWSKFKAAFDALEDAPEVKAVTKKTSEGQDIVFSERETGEIQKGDKGLIDGVDAEGEILMASGETYVFNSKGELEDIKEKEVVEPVDVSALVAAEVAKALENHGSDQITALKDEVTALKAANEKNQNIFASLKGLASENIVDDKEVKAKASDNIEAEETDIFSLSQIQKN